MKISQLMLLLVLFASELCLSATTSCSDFYQDSSRRRLSFLARHKYNIPKSDNVLTPNPTSGDVRLLHQSYLHLDSQNRPLEFGIVELIGLDGRVVDSSGMIQGQWREIKLNRAMQILILKNSYQIHLVKKVIIKHTHPTEFVFDDGITAGHFSKPDIESDNIAKDYLLNRADLAHLVLESYIVYFNPKFLMNYANFYPTDVLGDTQFSLEKKAVTVVGHSPK
jgi:hypothetical protein